jgi:VanZ family protein
MNKLLYWFAPLYTALIAVGSLMDNAVPSVSIDNIDKVYHAIAYLIMTIAWYIFFYARFLSKQSLIAFNLRTILENWSRTIAIGASVFSLIVGILIEFGQEYISMNRTMDVMDVLANFAGIILATITLMILDKSLQQDKMK